MNKNTELEILRYAKKGVLSDIIELENYISEGFKTLTERNDFYILEEDEISNDTIREIIKNKQQELSDVETINKEIRNKIFSLKYS